MKPVAVLLLALTAFSGTAQEFGIEEVRTVSERYRETNPTLNADRLVRQEDGLQKSRRFVGLDQSFLPCRDTLTRYTDAHGTLAGEDRYRRIMQQHAEEAEEQARQVEAERPQLAENLRRQGFLSSREFGLHEESRSRARDALEKVKSEWGTMRADCLRILTEMEAIVAAAE